MTGAQSIYYMSDRELRSYKRYLRRRREIQHRCAVIVFTLFLVAVSALSFQAIHSNAKSGAGEKFKYYTSVVVDKGDTVWSIADKFMDLEEYRGKNAYVTEVKSINHLNDKGDIWTGQVLIVPYYSYEYIQ